MHFSMPFLLSTYVLIGGFSNVGIETDGVCVCLYGRVIYEYVDRVIWHGLHGWPIVYFFFNVVYKQC